MPLSETFLITLTTTASATFLVCLRWLYRSKCSRVQCCGLLIERDIRREEEIDLSAPSESSKNTQESPTNRNQPVIRL